VAVVGESGCVHRGRDCPLLLPWGGQEDPHQLDPAVRVHTVRESVRGLHLRDVGPAECADCRRADHDRHSVAGPVGSLDQRRLYCLWSLPLLLEYDYDEHVVDYVDLQPLELRHVDGLCRALRDTLEYLLDLRRASSLWKHRRTQQEIPIGSRRLHHR